MDFEYQQVLARRKARLLSDYTVAGKRGIEVGPLNRPVVRRDEAEVYYVDHCTTEELNRKYVGYPEHTSGLEEIDFVWGEQSLVELLGDIAPLDFIVAAHVIEHVPDLRGWLGEMHDALKVGGRLLLIIPDKRFTFDIYRRLSSWEEVVQAHQEKRRRPGMRVMLDHFANIVDAPTWPLWDNYETADNLQYHHGPEILESAMKQYLEGQYMDVHTWVFTPWHFMHLMGRMVSEMALRFDLKFFLTTQDHDLEFYVQLERVDEPSTEWAGEASDARNGAIWPPGAPQIPADGIVSKRSVAIIDNVENQATIPPPRFSLLQRLKTRLEKL
ncbi:methyltransferase domain-containing protein [Rhizobium sp. BK399]|uniref:methyltransferase domain-containing protein n=1 Tax=Rhizobium sp. BK399 TaxID=2587063 RepID=UPI00160D87B2|nr:methyltransferase domain-containing protein [Rhizobium sp. BK399]MBB3542448.1 SAM-dependent methyltransferase [Rhizobium sp. BK399]